MGKKSLKLNFHGRFWAFLSKNVKDFVWKFVDSKETLPFFFFYCTKPKCLSVSITAESDFFFLLPRSWIWRFMPSWAFPLRISVVAAIKHTRLFAARIFTVHARLLAAASAPRAEAPEQGLIQTWAFLGFVLHKMPCATVTSVALLVRCGEISRTSTSKLNVLSLVVLPVRKCQESQLRTNTSFLFPYYE